MKKYNNDYKFFLCLLAFLIGLIVAFNISTLSFQYEKLAERATHFNHRIVFNFAVFYKIFSRNLLVSILLSVVSFIGFGILSPAIMFLNGVYIGEMIHFNGVSFKNIYVYFVFHGPIEIISFSIFGSFGLRGIKFYRDYFKYGWDVAQKNIPKFTEFIFPVVLLFIAALIESLLISNY